MDKYHMELVNPDDNLIREVVNQGIDSYLQGVTDSTFRYSIGETAFSGRSALICDVAPNDLRVIIRRLLELERDIADDLVSSIACTLGIDDIWLTVDDEFYIDRQDASGSVYVDFKDDNFWIELFNSIDQEQSE